MDKDLSEPVISMSATLFIKDFLDLVDNFVLTVGALGINFEFLVGLLDMVVICHLSPFPEGFDAEHKGHAQKTNQNEGN